jgi:phage virion morphogenesis protein
MIELEIIQQSLDQALAKLRYRLTDASRLMRHLAGQMHDAVEENFAQQGRPKWMGLKAPVNPRRRGGMILQDSGRLAASIVMESDADTARVGTNVRYAAIHQFGGRTPPHLIRPRDKKALAFGGRVVKRANHPGSKIPPRRFLAYDEGDAERMEASVSDYLAAAIDQ